MPFIVEPRRLLGIDTLRLAAVSSDTLGATAAKLVDMLEPFGGAPFGPWADARERAKALVGAGELPLLEGRRLIVREVTRSKLMDEIGFRALGLPELADGAWPWSTVAMVAAFNRTFGGGVQVVLD